MLSNYEDWSYPWVDSPFFIFTFTLLAAIFMGFALIPTTLLAVLTGSIWGWQAFPYLVAAYTLASVLGYLLGKTISADLLETLLGQYPKAQKVVAEKQNRMGNLIFFIRISPAIPFAFSNILFALLSTGLQKVIWFGLWGMLPRTTLAFSSGVFAESLYNAIKNRGMDSTMDLLLLFTFLLIGILGIWHFFRSKS
ncbi:hypothetical protein ADIS_1663 [Lunatimonas lonarensis]|uniref:TVP38/TMEM64 family membrane protein n=1 Tax=Lunatimonas lonarensis TaxID=1232681 RepID=R7ZUT9_9BACT|nr:hypothetical protein ADIS_1663 [Lunatimonas lonarensis]